MADQDGSRSPVAAGINRLEGWARRVVTRASERVPRQTIQQKYPQYEIGRGTYGHPWVPPWDNAADLRIGAFCSIAHGVQIVLGGEHRPDWVTTFPFSIMWPNAPRVAGQPRSRGDVVIGNDVWIGMDATIMSGVTIGDGAVVGAGAVVRRDVDPYTIVVGNPALPVRKRFDDETVERLLAIRWWDWDDETIERFLPLMLSDRIDEFLTVAEREGPSA